MPHHLKYVPAHSGSTASRPSRANCRTSSQASHGFFSRFKRSTFCALVSFGAAAGAFGGTAATGTSVLKGISKLHHKGGCIFTAGLRRVGTKSEAGTRSATKAATTPALRGNAHVIRVSGTETGGKPPLRCREVGPSRFSAQDRDKCDKHTDGDHGPGHHRSQAAARPPTRHLGLQNTIARRDQIPKLICQPRQQRPQRSRR